MELVNDVYVNETEEESPIFKKKCVFLVHYYGCVKYISLSFLTYYINNILYRQRNRKKRIIRRHSENDSDATVTDAELLEIDTPPRNKSTTNSVNANQTISGGQSQETISSEALAEMDQKLSNSVNYVNLPSGL